MMERKPCKACGTTQKWTANTLFEKNGVCSRECFRDLMLRLIATHLANISHNR